MWHDEKERDNFKSCKEETRGKGETINSYASQRKRISHQKQNLITKEAKINGEKKSFVGDNKVISEVQYFLFLHLMTFFVLLCLRGLLQTNVKNDKTPWDCESSSNYFKSLMFMD